LIAFSEQIEHLSGALRRHINALIERAPIRRFLLGYQSRQVHAVGDAALRRVPLAAAESLKIAQTSIQAHSLIAQFLLRFFRRRDQYLALVKPLV